jgi:hypothetical protein
VSERAATVEPADGGGHGIGKLLISLGMTTLRKGHWVMFVLGIFLPIFWIIGAVMPPTTPQPA